MEPQDDDDKKGSLITILCICFAIATVGLGAYTILDKTVFKDDKCVAEQSDGKKTGGTYANEKGYVYKPELGEFGTYYVSKTGKVYFAASDTFWSDGGKWTPTMDEKVGTKKTIKLNVDDYYDFACNGACDDDGNMEIEAFELNVSDIQYVKEMVFGNQKTHVATALIDKDGNMSILKSETPEDGEKTRFKLVKDVEKNVASVGTGEMYNYYPMVFYRDGATKRLDDKELMYSVIEDAE
jgi:hypothetical protein